MSSNWPTKKLGDIIELKYGKGIPRHERKANGRYPIYGANGELGRTDKYLTEGDALIIGRKGSAGEVTRVSGRFWPADVTYYVFGNNQIDIDYLFYVLKQLDLKQLATGIKPGINRNKVYELEIPIPPIEEQRRIIQKIEHLFTKIDEAARLRAESLSSSATLLPSALHHVFSRAKKEGWPIKQVGEICEKPQYGYTASANQEKVGPKLLRITDIQNGHVDWGQVPYCKCEDAPKYQLYSGDIVFARTGATVGKSFFIEYLPEKAVFASYLIRLRPKEGVLGKYLYAFFQSPDYWQQIAGHQIGAAQPNVNASKLSKIKIPLPPIPEQKKIAAYLDGISEKSRALQALQRETAADLTAFKQSILAKAFKGELLTHKMICKGKSV